MRKRPKRQGRITRCAVCWMTAIVLLLLAGWSIRQGRERREAGFMVVAGLCGLTAIVALNKEKA